LNLQKSEYIKELCKNTTANNQLQQPLDFSRAKQSLKMHFSQYVHQFMKDTDKYQTHLSFNKGKYNVPDEKYDEFYQQYYSAMIKN